MADQPSLATRRDALIERAHALLSDDPRLLAGWLEGSIADGTADPYSDIDLHLAVGDDVWDEVWNERFALVARIAPIVASADIPGGFGGIGCLVSARQG